MSTAVIDSMIKGAGLAVKPLKDLASSRESFEKSQRLTLKKILGLRERTSIEKDLGLSPEMSAEDFASNVPVLTYDSYIEMGYIDRMKKGENNVMVNKEVIYFATSSGTTGKPKLLPITQEDMDAYRPLTTDIFMGFIDKYGARGIGMMFGGKMLAFPASGFVNVPDTKIKVGYVSWLMGRDIDTKLKEKIVPEADSIAAFDWKEKAYQCIKPAIDEDITTLLGSTDVVVPAIERLLTSNEWHERLLRETNRFKDVYNPETKTVDLKKLWPKLKVIVNMGAPITKHEAEFRELFGKDIILPDFYGASEGAIGVSIGNGNCFLNPAYYYEVIENYKKVPLFNRIERVNEKYPIVITTPSLTSYLMKDEIEIRENRTFLPLGRIDRVLSIFGEKISEDSLDIMILDVCKTMDIPRTNIYGFTVKEIREKGIGYYDFCISAEDGINTEKLSIAIHNYFMKHNNEYESKADEGSLLPPKITFVERDLFLKGIRFDKKLVRLLH